jgi:hypothetical protein
MTQTAEATVKVGDFFLNSWGYDQTNADFYRVLSVSKSGKTIKIQKVHTTVEDRGSGCTRVRPTAAPFSRTFHRKWVDGEEVNGEFVETAPVLTKRVQSYGPGPDKVYVTMDHGWTTLYDVDADNGAHATASGWGH